MFLQLKYYLFLFIALAAVAMLSKAFFAPTMAQTIEAFLEQRKFQGAVLIAKDGNILLSKGYGFANAEHRISNTSSTVFRLGSITKQVTAVAILQLQEKGLLSVDDPIKKYLPHYTMGKKITIHHLLSHTAGVPSITEFANLPEIQRHPVTPDEVITYFNGLPLRFEPGSDCEYSDSGYIVLGAIIEAVTKKPYEVYVQEHIFQPLGMHSSYYDHHELIIPNRASGYAQEDGKIRHANFLDMSLPHASGALASTVEDLYQFDRALTGTSLLSQSSLETMYTIHGSSRAHRIAYGYGVMLGPQNEGMEGCDASVTGHFGFIEGFEAALINYPDSDLTIILLSNVEKTPVNELHKELEKLLSDYFWRNHAAL